MIDIYDIQGNIIRKEHITASAKHEQELSKSDFIRLSWEDTEKYILPVGTYIIHDGMRWQLLEPYEPKQKNEAHWTYEPEFQHPKMYLGKVIFTLPTKDSEAQDYEAQEWTYTGFALTLLQYFCDGINKVFGFTADEDKITYKVIGEVKASASCTFSNADYLSALTEAANQFDCEWHIAWNQRILYFGDICFDRDELATPILKVGDNVGVPNISNPKEGYANYFKVQGSTRNMTRRVASGEHVATNMRLTLDPEKYPTGYMDMRNSADEPIIQKALILEDIYPHIDLYAYNVRYRLRYMLDSQTNEKVVSYYKEDGTPVYKTYAIWYMRLAYPTRDAEGNVVKWTDFIVAESIDVLKNRRTQQEYKNASIMEDIVKAMEPLTIPVDEPKYTDEPWSADNTPVNICIDWEAISEHLGIHVASVLDLYNLTPEQAEDIRTGIPAVWSKMVRNRYYDISKVWDEYANQSGILAQIDKEIEEGGETEGTGLLVDGKTLMCTFQPNLLSDKQGILTAMSSSLAGREFALAYHTKDSHVQDSTDIEEGGFNVKTGDYEIIFEEENDIVIPTIPTEGLIPRGQDIDNLNHLADLNDGLKGNLVLLFNIVMGSAYKKQAQTDLENAALKEIAYLRSDRNSYTVASNPVAFETDNPGLYIGRKVIYDDGNGYRLDTRVQKLVTQLDFDFCEEITVGNEVRKGTQTQLKEQVQQLMSGNAEGSGLNEVQVRNILKDYTEKRFLSKVSPDTADGLIRFLRGISVGSGTHGIDASGNATLKGITAEGVSNEDFVSSMLHGNGFGIWIDDNGKSHIESDYFAVRMKAYFEELTINRRSFSSGDQLFSNAGMTVYAVQPVIRAAEMSLSTLSADEEETEQQEEDVITAYRLYEYSDDGDKALQSSWQVGDMALCRTFNIKAGVYQNVSNRYYWRKVVAVGQERFNGKTLNYIDLSVTDCDPSAINDVPIRGDVVVQCGSTDPLRQKAISIDINGENAPAITGYSGINDYNLSTHITWIWSPERVVMQSKYISLIAADGTTSDFESYIKQSSEGISLGLLRDMGVTGRNELQGTGGFLPPMSSIDAWQTAEETLFGNVVKQITLSGGRNAGWHCEIKSDDIEAPDGSLVWLSLWIKANRDVDMSLSCGTQYDSGFTCTFYDDVEQVGEQVGKCRLTTEWQRVRISAETFTPYSGDNPLIIFYPYNASESDVTIYLSSLKLETGRQVTDWSPNPQDSDAELYNAGIEIKKGLIHLKAKNTIIDSDVTVNSLQTQSKDGVYARLVGDELGFYGTGNKANIRIGVDSNGLSALRLFDDSGTETWRLSATDGLIKIGGGSSTVSARTDVLTFYPVMAGTTTIAEALSGATTDYYQWFSSYEVVNNVKNIQDTTHNEHIYTTNPSVSGFGAEIADGYYLLREKNGSSASAKYRDVEGENGRLTAIYISRLYSVSGGKITGITNVLYTRDGHMCDESGEQRDDDIII